MRLYLLVILFALPLLAGREPIGRETYARVDIAGIGYERLESLKSEKGLHWWVELDDQLLVRTHEDVVIRLGKDLAVEVLDVPVDDSRLVVAGVAHGHDAHNRVGSVLAWGGRFAVMQLDSGQTIDDLFVLEDGRFDEGACHATWKYFEPREVLARDVTNDPPRPLAKRLTEVSTLVDSVDGARWLADVTTLSGFSRVSGSEEIDEATRWLFQQFDQLPYSRVITEDFIFGNVRATNVIATLEGTRNPEDLYIVGAHYDSIGTRDAGNTAPGAEDNASGTAAVLEMARIFNVFRPHGTVIFICYSGEEQGLYGSWDHVSKLINAGLDGNVKLVCNMDMIGYTGDDELDVLLETGGEGLFTLDLFSDAAANYTSLSVATSTNPFGSDHVPYIRNNIPALLTIENDWDSYPGYHRGTDTVEKVSEAMGREIIKMNVAAIATLGGFEGHDNPVEVLVP